MGERSVVKSGDLLLQNKGILKTTWQNKYCLLYGGSGDSSCHLEFFENRNSFIENKTKNKPCDKKVELQNVKAVINSAENGNDGTRKYQIEIKCKNNTCLMFDSESDCSDWFSKLQSATGFSSGRGSSSSQNREDENENDINEDYDDESEVITLNQMYDGTGGAQAQRFSVNVEPCQLAKLCEIEGTMTMLVTNQCISFEDPKTRQNKYLFQLSWMRRFGKKSNDQFYFECGRKCPNGEGTVTCISASAAEIHKVITTKSSSNASTVIPAKQKKFKGVVEKKSPDAKPKASAAAPNITVPALVQKRLHPGPANVPTLVPIKTEASEYDDCVSVTSQRNSLRKVSGTDANVGHISQNDFTHELEVKLHAGDDQAKHLSVKKLSVTESKKEKKDREKREKKEAEEREKREKKEAEEREKREKKEAEEREKERLKREKKEKEEKEKKMKEDKKKGKKKVSTNRSAGAYDDVDEDASSTCSASAADDPAYAEATSPSPLAKSKGPKPGDRIYDNPDVAKAMPREEPPQYAEPYRTSGGVSIVADDGRDAYSEVKDISKAAWRKQGREEKEMCHEEDYSVLKQARQQSKGPPPDIPARRYSQSDGEDEESTYDTMATNVSKPSGGMKPENLYGMASAKKVGLLLPKTPSAGNDPEDSGEEEENEYSHCADPGTYEEAVTVSVKKSPPAVQPSSLYEETNQPLSKASIKASKPSLKSKQAPAESLYEEVKM